MEEFLVKFIFLTGYVINVKIKFSLNGAKWLNNSRRFFGTIAISKIIFRFLNSRLSN